MVFPLLFFCHLYNSHSTSRKADLLIDLIVSRICLEVQIIEVTIGDN